MGERMQDWEWWFLRPYRHRLARGVLSLALVYALAFAGILDAAHRAHAAGSFSDPVLAEFCSSGHESGATDPHGDGTPDRHKGALSCCLPAVPLGGLVTLATDPTPLRKIYARDLGPLANDLYVELFPPAAQGTPRAPPLLI